MCIYIYKYICGIYINIYVPYTRTYICHILPVNIKRSIYSLFGACFCLALIFTIIKNIKTTIALHEGNSRLRFSFPSCNGIVVFYNGEY